MTIGSRELQQDEPVRLVGSREIEVEPEEEVQTPEWIRCLVDHAANEGGIR